MPCEHVMLGCSKCRDEVDRLRAENERLRARRDEEHQHFLAWRDVETPCERCAGAGTYSYPDTSTWRRGGVAGQAFTRDVCDGCWGTGDKHRTGFDLRKVRSLAYDRDRYRDALRELVEAVGEMPARMPDFATIGEDYELPVRGEVWSKLWPAWDRARAMLEGADR